MGDTYTVDKRWHYAYFILLDGTARTASTVRGNAESVQRARESLLKIGFVEVTQWEHLWFQLLRILPRHVPVYTVVEPVGKTPHTDAMWAPGGEGELRPRGTS